MGHRPPAEPMGAAQGLRTNQQLLNCRLENNSVQEVLGAGTPGSGHNSRTSDQQTLLSPVMSPRACHPCSLPPPVVAVRMKESEEGMGALTDGSGWSTARDWGWTPPSPPQPPRHPVGRLGLRLCCHPAPRWPASTRSAGSAWQEQLWKPRFPVSEASVGLHQTNTKQNPGKV